ncbi:hypothetical protein APF79_10970 [bacterium BRH_c32]|nr:MAG: hypothetical protein APF79_10970 [bacterium BRH_c32]
MKKILIFSIVLLLPILIHGQEKNSWNEKRERGDRSERMRKMEQYEQAKLIEALNLNEDTSIRFFSRRNEFHAKVKDLIDERDRMINKMEKETSASDKVKKNDLREQINLFLLQEEKILKEKNAFISSLKELLSEEQIAKFLVVENKFRHGVRDFIFKKESRETQKK